MVGKLSRNVLRHKDLQMRVYPMRQYVSTNPRFSMTHKVKLDTLTEQVVVYQVYLLSNITKDAPGPLYHPDSELYMLHSMHHTL